MTESISNIRLRHLNDELTRVSTLLEEQRDKLQRAEADLAQQRQTFAETSPIYERLAHPEDHPPKEDDKEADDAELNEAATAWIRASTLLSILPIEVETAELLVASYERRIEALKKDVAQAGGEEQDKEEQDKEEQDKSE